MSNWNGKAGAGGSPEFVHVDAAGGSSSDKDKSNAAGTQKAKPANSNQRGRGNSQTATSSNSASNWQTAISRLLDTSKPEDTVAIRRLGEDVRASGANGARAVVELLRLRMGEKNATPEVRSRAIAIARVLAQRSAAGVDAQRLISAPQFITTLKQAASDPNVRNSLKTWASQIRIGDPNDATILSSVTGLDEHLTQSSETASQSPEATRRPPLNPNGSSFATHATVDEDPDEDLHSGVRIHTTGSRNAGEPAPATGPFIPSVPGGFGIDGTVFDGATPMVAGGMGGLPGMREFPASSIQPIPPPLTGPRASFGTARSGWGDEDDGVQSDAPSTRSRRTAARPMQPGFNGATLSMDGGHEARDRLGERNPRSGNGRGRTTRTSSLADGTLSDPDEPDPRGRHQAVPVTTPEDPRMYGQRAPAPAAMPARQRARSRHPSVSPDRSGLRSRSPSPTTTGRSRATSRARSRRRGAGSGADPAVVLINLAGVQFVRVIQEYYAMREGELTLREGEVLTIIRPEDGGRYWLGHCRGQVGRFPAEVVEILSHQPRDSAARDEKTAELLRRAREIDDFMDQLHDFDITRYCITEDRDIQTDLSALLALRNELVRHLDDTTTGVGRLKAMLNRIKEAQRVHDRMIDSRIAGYTARSNLHDNTPRNPYQELPGNPIQYAQYDMSQYMRRTSAPHQIEQPPQAQSPPTRQQQPPQIGIYNNNPAAALRYRQVQEMGYPPRAGMPPRSRTYSYTPAAAPPRGQAPGRGVDDDQSSAYISSEPTTPGETTNSPPTMGAPPLNGGLPQHVFPVQQQNTGERWGEHPKEADVDAGRQRAGRGSHVPSESSAHTHASRRNGF
ncbi:hypothetical protein FRC12_001331 [Ceratobasidium sp. 428]|nr:hypothetical protein FRC12_001331 [Ceratobasidium sp. 428]